jgi:hypothetical protein
MQVSRFMVRVQLVLDLCGHGPACFFDRHPGCGTSIAPFPPVARSGKLVRSGANMFRIGLHDVRGRRPLQNSARSRHSRE